MDLHIKSLNTDTKNVNHDSLVYIYKKLSVWKLNNKFTTPGISISADNDPPQGFHYALM